VKPSEPPRQEEADQKSESVMAKAFIVLLTSPPAQTVMKSKGFEEL